MTVTCPAGHVSATDDYCDQCGARIAGVPVAAAIPAPDAAAPDTSATPVTAPCPQCGAPRAGRDRFCEDCGFDFVAGVVATRPDDEGDESASVAAAPTWAAGIAPDRDYFERLAPDGLSFPAGETGRTIVLDGARLRIGRAGAARGAEVPDIEVADPAVSRLHATLLRASGGGWAVVDEGSSNGTYVNGDDAPIDPHVEIALCDGDRVHLGAWTTITLALRSRAA